jgi:hypothetical protein
MNERIRELIAQATKRYEPDWNGAPAYEDFDKRKFAELIVRECMAKVCEELDNSYSEDGKEILNERVLEHFGVEE